MNSTLARRPLRPAGYLAAATVVIAMASAAMAGPAATAPWSFPLTMPADQLSGLCGRDGMWLEQWLDADLRYDPDTDGIHGRVTIGQEFWLRDTKSLADCARVSRYEGPLERCRKLDIEVWSPAEGRSRRIADSDLVWRGQLGAGGGVIYLDVTEYGAVIPGLRIGDRLRLTWHWEYSGLHGLPPQDLRREDESPTLSTYRLTVPLDQQLTFQCVGPDSLAACVQEARSLGKGFQHASWEFRDHRTADQVQARRPAGTLVLVPHLAVPDDKRSATSFVAAGTWAAAAAAYRQHVHALLDPTPEVAALARSVVAGKSTATERIAALYGYVQTTTRYLGLFNGRGGIIPAAPASTCKAGYGDCKGLSSYFIALCRAIDIAAWPVLVLAGDDRQLAVEQPNLTQFNHFIVWADDGRGGCWIDPTLEDVPAGQLMPIDALQPVLTTQPGAEGLCRIPHAVWDPGRRRVDVIGNVDESLRLRANVTITADGPGAELLGLAIAEADERSRETRTLDMLLAAPLRSAAIPADAADTTGSPLTWHRAFRTAQPLPGGGDRLFLPSEIANVPELVGGTVANRDAIDPRRRPDRIEHWQLDLPEGWGLAEPDSFSISSPGLTWTRTMSQSGQRLLLGRHITWADTAITSTQEALLAKALGDAVIRERSPVQLRRRVP